MTNTSNSTLGPRRLILEVPRKMNCASDTCGVLPLRWLMSCRLRTSELWLSASRSWRVNSWRSWWHSSGVKKKALVSPCSFLKVYTHKREFYQSALLLLFPAVNTIPQVQTFTRDLSFSCKSSCPPGRTENPAGSRALEDWVDDHWPSASIVK